MKRFAAVRGKKDANHSAIVDDLRKQGIHVINLNGVGNGIPDILTTYKNKVVFIEIKIESGSVKKGQIYFMGTYPGFCGLANSVDSAILLAKCPEKYALTTKQKMRLMSHWAIMDSSQIKMSKLLTLI